ncbi:hypothetical protein [Microscilla marina]|uniref:Uncharacterized protein n=1 Tax=Microscilla marina ATCC 23134 TaxID=313606 RepID=A1ZF84_MICM2|nr:hypothetical protein [Microscilla marina]EAY31186.1 hypothetical protein M23134_07596 [Microscilla marina ATCC 23134]
MDIVNVTLFYILLSLVPVDKNQFQISTKEPESKTEVTINFIRSLDKWQAVKSTEKEGLSIYFKDKTAYIKTLGSDSYAKIDWLEKAKVVTNHKKWSKVTKVTVKQIATKPFIFSVTKEGKNRRVIKLKATHHPEVSQKTPVVHVSWK